MSSNQNYSGLMSVYKNVKPIFLEESLASVFRQSLLPAELLIVKDGPLNDELDQIIDKYKNTYSYIVDVITLEKNIGQGAVYKKILPLCKFDYIALMDSDDILKENKNELQLAYMLEHDEIDIIGSNTYEFSTTINEIETYRRVPENHDDIVRFCKRRCPVIQPASMMKKRAVLKSGGYHEGRIAEDWDLYIRMVKNGCKFHNIQEPLLYFRINDELYRRRGGIRILRKLLAFKTYWFRDGFMDLSDYIISSCASIVVCLLPNVFRLWIYKNLLRKNVVVDGDEYDSKN